MKLFVSFKIYIYISIYMVDIEVFEMMFSKQKTKKIIVSLISDDLQSSSYECLAVSSENQSEVSLVNK